MYFHIAIQYPPIQSLTTNYNKSTITSCPTSILCTLQIPKGFSNNPQAKSIGAHIAPIQTHSHKLTPMILFNFQSPLFNPISYPSTQVDTIQNWTTTYKSISNITWLEISFHTNIYIFFKYFPAILSRFNKKLFNLDIPIAITQQHLTN